MYIRCRDQAVAEMASLLDTDAQRLPPPPIVRDRRASAYVAAVQRDCVRELYGLVQAWRCPSTSEWRVFPETEGTLQKQHDLLIVRIYAADSASAPRCADDLNAEFLILHFTADGQSTSAAWSVERTLAGSRSLAFLKTRVMADLASRCVQGPDTPWASRDRGYYATVGYIGDLLGGSVAAQMIMFRHETADDWPEIIRCLAGFPVPDVEWCHPREILESPQVNEAQRQALQSLSKAVTLVRGPPGTGKSQTVVTLTLHSVPAGEAVCITAVQNRAIEAIADKFHSENVPFVTFGSRLTGVSTLYTMEEQVDRDPLVVASSCHLHRLESAHALMRAGLQTLLDNVYKPPQDGEDSHRTRARADLVDRLCANPSQELADCLAYREWLEEHHERPERPAARRSRRSLVEEFVKISVNPWKKTMVAIVQHRYHEANELQSFLMQEVESANYRLVRAKRTARETIAANARALLCTTASVGGALRAPDLVTLSSRLQTVVVDEAGTVADRHLLPILVRCPVRRLVFVGDTQQLPVFTNLRRTEVVSTMQRLEQQQDPQLPSALLSIQYRMPPQICTIVSRYFYDGLLESAAVLGTEGSGCVQFKSVKGRAERESPTSFSMQNLMEVQAAADVVRTLVAQSTGAELPIAIITPYAAQIRALEARMGGLVRDGAIEIVTVDAAQGREWPHVVFSTVSTDPRRCGFIKDRRRLCVALSRCQKTMTLIAHPDLVAEVPALDAFRAAATGDDMALPVETLPVETLAEVQRITCAICLEDVHAPEPAGLLTCNHQYHAACIERALARDRRCPMCRRSVHPVVLADEGIPPRSVPAQRTSRRVGA
jgi:hypothetical protein